MAVSLYEAQVLPSFLTSLNGVPSSDDEQKAQLEQAIRQEIAHQVATILSRLPLPEVMFSFPQAAKLLCLHPETLRSYTRLPVGHPRRLRYVDCTGTSRGQRITAAELLAWQ